MRILLLVHYYLPNLQSSAKIIHDLARELQSLGHEVIIAAPDEGLAQPCQIRDEAGLVVVRVRSGRFRNVSRVLRALNEWRLSALLWRRAKRFFIAHRCELIVNYSPTIFFGPLVRRLRRLWDCRSYLVLRDIFPQWSIDAGLLAADGLAARILRHYERVLYDAADTIGVQSPKNLEYFERRGLAGRYRLEVLYNWAPTRQEIPRTTLRRELGLDDKVVFFYGGNIGVAQDVGQLLRLAAALRDRPEIFFLFVGDGSEAPQLARRAAEQGLVNVRFHPPVPPSTYLGLVAEFDVGLIALAKNLSTHNFPGKMLDYMACAKPILASINPGNDLRDILTRHRSGLVCTSGEDELCRRYALQLADDAGLRRELGSNGRALLESHFSSARAARQVLAHGSAVS